MNSTPKVKFHGEVTGRFSSSQPNRANTPQSDDRTSEQERAAYLLAVELHREYRAAEKAMNGPNKTDTVPSLKDGVTLRHDHGWDGCHKQAYFVRRAALVIKRASVRNPATLGEAEQALDATILIRRLMVEGSIPFAEGGEIAPGKPYLVGEHSTDFADTLNDAQRKALRDAAVRGVLRGDRTFTFRTVFEQPKDGQPMDKPRVEVRTNAVSGNPPIWRASAAFRGVR